MIRGSIVADAAAVTDAVVAYTAVVVLIVPHDEFLSTLSFSLSLSLSLMSFSLALSFTLSLSLFFLSLLNSLFLSLPSYRLLVPFLSLSFFVRSCSLSLSLLLPSRRSLFLCRCLISFNWTVEVVSLVGSRYFIVKS